MAAAIETLADTPVTNGARRIIVLGRMGELGAHGPAAHLHVGELAAQRQLTVLAVGEGAEGIARGAQGRALIFRSSKTPPSGCPARSNPATWSCSRAAAPPPSNES